jgi:hypothetical protein
MRKFSVSSKAEQIELQDVSLMELVYEWECLLPSDLDRIADMAPGEVLPIWSENGEKFTITRTE